jgi:hypothetical protein
MTAQLHHTIVAAHDKHTSATACAVALRDGTALQDGAAMPVSGSSVPGACDGSWSCSRT